MLAIRIYNNAILYSSYLLFEHLYELFVRSFLFSLIRRDVLNRTNADNTNWYGVEFIINSPGRIKTNKRFDRIYNYNFDGLFLEFKSSHRV